MNKIIILLLLLVLLILIYNKIVNSKERFNSFLLGKKPNFIFLDKKEASKVIYSITTFDKYNKKDREIRNIRAETDLADHYSSKLLNWSDNDKLVMNWLFNSLKESIPKKYRFLFYDIEFAKFKNEVEHGFPHTNKNCIFICEHIINKTMKFMNNNDNYGAMKHIGSMIIHECVHIWQRRDPDFFLELYSCWGFYHAKKIYNFNKYRKVSRYNPDGVELTWVFNLNTVKSKECVDCYNISAKPDNVILPAALYRDTAKDISEVNLVGIYLEKLGNTYAIPPFAKSEFLSNIDEFVEMFGSIAYNNYHPNEVAAEIVSIYLTEQILDEKESGSLALQRYKTIFNRKK